MVRLLCKWYIAISQYVSIRYIGISIIHLYKYIIAPYLPECCIFKLSCSEYTRLAILKYGLFKGSFKGLVRLSHCHPFVSDVIKYDFEKI